MAALVVATGCTHWGTKTVNGQKREVNRVLIGAPQIAETRSASAKAGFLFGRNRNAAAGGLSGSAGSMTRKHCVQKAQIEYVQPYALHPVPAGRPRDLAIGAAASFLGLAIIVGAKIASISVFEPGDPLYERPPDPSTGYALGGLSIAGGIGTIAYSYLRLPAGPPPPIQNHERRWQETRLVESTGCGLVPGDRAGGGGSSKKPSGDVEQRLRKLERLRKDGIISEKEYRKKKKKLLEEL